MIAVRKEWTHDEAVAATLRFMEGGGDPFDRSGPYAQWLALQQLELLHRRFEGGKQYALASAFRLCATFDIKIPRWAADAYLEGFDKIIEFRAKSWDVVFGPAVPKGKHLAALRKRTENASDVRKEVWRHHRAGKAIDDELFASVGKKYGIGATLTKEYYISKQRKVDAMRKALADPTGTEAEILRGWQMLLRATKPKK